MTQNIIETHYLTKSFKHQQVLKDVTLTIPQNCVYGLLGANGAGKSTLLKTMTGLLRPTSGEILFRGHSWTRADLSQIGSLIETPPIYENLTALENLQVRAQILNVPKDRIQEVLQIVGLENTEKRKQARFLWE